ncbi:MAG: hypothetical protein ACJASV_002347, partial [Pseudorhodobacter sp.]
MPNTAVLTSPATPSAHLPFPSQPGVSFDDLLLPVAAILDPKALLAGILAEIAASPDADGRAQRAITVGHLAAARARANEVLAQAFEADPTN